MGDFNDCLSASKKSGGPVNKARCDRFATNLDRCNLLDLGSSGARFTWSGQRRGHIQTMIRLDRVMATTSWRLRFDDARVRVLPRTHSDHNAVLLVTRAHSKDCSNRLSCAEEVWLSHSSFKDFFASVWLPYQASLSDALHNFKVKVAAWNRDVFGNIFQKRKLFLLAE